MRSVGNTESLAMRVEPTATLRDLIERATAQPPIRVAVVNADQGIVLETIRDAQALGLIEPLLIGRLRIVRDSQSERMFNLFYGGSPNGGAADQPRP